jgi:hypothetical protein
MKLIFQHLLTDCFPALRRKQANSRGIVALFGMIMSKFKENVVYGWENAFVIGIDAEHSDLGVSFYVIISSLLKCSSSSISDLLIDLKMSCTQPRSCLCNLSWGSAHAGSRDCMRMLTNISTTDDKVSN